MVIRIHDSARWRKLPNKKTLLLTGDKARKVLLEVNCPEPTQFYLVEGERSTFMANVHGLETIEFYADGVCEVVPTSEGDIWYYTDDGDETGYETDNPSFVRIWQRQTVNPDLARIMQRVEYNMERKAARIKDELDAYLARREAEIVAARANPETGEIDESNRDAVSPAVAEPSAEEPEVLPAGKA